MHLGVNLYLHLQSHLSPHVRMHLQLPPAAHQLPAQNQSPLKRLSPSHSQDYAIGDFLICSLPPCDLSSPNWQTTIQCAPCATKPSTSKSSFESRSSALQSHLNWYIQMSAVHSLLPLRRQQALHNILLQLYPLHIRMNAPSWEVGNLHHRLQGLKKCDDQDRYKAPYPTP